MGEAAETGAAGLRAGGTKRAGAPPSENIVTGTILELASTKRRGIIRAEDGSRVLFSVSDVVGAIETLVVGHRVTFDLVRTNAVKVMRQPSAAMPRNYPEQHLDLRYAGFDQAQSIRKYKFDNVADNNATGHFVITVDLTLLRKHNISMQELPALCLRKLLAHLEITPELSIHELGSEDLLDYVSARTAALERKARARKPFRRANYPQQRRPAPLC